jgi:hypothetical protein
LKSHSVLCRPQSPENVPVLFRLTGGFGCVVVGEFGEDVFLSIFVWLDSVILVHFVSTVGGFGERERVRGI